jgi:hypothetical protein
MIADSSEDTDNLFYIELYFESDESLGYIFANYSNAPSANGFDEIIILPEVNSEGEWYNFQRNLFDDFVSSFGSEPNTALSQIYLYVEADTGGRLEVLFDDMYLYNDPAPGISGISLTTPIADVGVNVSAQVFDLSSFTVTMYYRIDGGAWTDVAMVDTGAGFNGTIPGQIQGTEVDFYIEAEDEFGQISQSSQTGYLVPEDHEPPPLNLIPLLAAVTGIAVVVVIVVYIFFIRPKQSGE